MFSDREDDFFHHHFLFFCPLPVVIDLFGQLCQLCARQKMFLVREADRWILGRNKEPRRKQDICAGPAEKIQYVSVASPLRIRLADRAQHLEKSTVVPVRVKIINDQQQPASIACYAGNVKFKQLLRRYFLPAQPVLEADLRDGIEQVFVKRSKKAGTFLLRRVLQGQRGLAAASVPGDPERALSVSETVPDPLQFLLPALENPPAPGRL